MPKLNPARPIILCPLEYEAAALRRCGLAIHSGIEVCGPGADNVRRWVERRGATIGSAPSERQTVILVGLAGGLRHDRPEGSAWVIGEVIDERGNRRRPTLAINGPQPAIIVSTAAVIGDVGAKVRCAARTGAELVDQEAAAFAEAADTLGWEWGVIRGVSDGLDSALPPSIDRWVDARGRPRPLTIAGSLLLRPWWWPAVLRLASDSRRAMEGAAELLQSTLVPDRSAPKPGNNSSH